MKSVKIIGGAITKFGRHLDRNRPLRVKAVNGALTDAGIDKGGFKVPGSAMPPRGCSRDRKASGGRWC